MKVQIRHNEKRLPRKSKKQRIVKVIRTLRKQGLENDICFLSLTYPKIPSNRPSNRIDWTIESY